MTSVEIRQKYIQFFESKGHKHIPSAPLIPEHDPTVLFTTAGMHPLVPYLMGEVHPEGARLVNHQKCIRTTDIDEVGDDTHLTFFEMLGNWSLGDYFKKEAIEWSFEFLTSKKWLGIDRNFLAVSVFAGDADAPKDDESAEIWLKLGIPKERIAYLSKEDNWWGPAGKTGPCGPDTEMFYFTGERDELTAKFDSKDKRWVEIWNDVFMQYNKQDDGTFELLKQKNVDTGMGLERIAAVLQGKRTVFETDLFKPIIDAINEFISETDTTNFKLEPARLERYRRIIADHIKAATFILGDQYGIVPSNIGQGYILRRLIRRAIRFAHQLGIEKTILSSLSRVAVKQYSGMYPELRENEAFVYEQIELEEQKFQKMIARGIREFERVYYVDLYKTVIKKLAELYPEGDLPLSIKEKSTTMILNHFTSYLSKSAHSQMEPDEEEASRQSFIEAVLQNSHVIAQEFSQEFSELAFTLYDTYGFPFELTHELALEKGITLDEKLFEKAYEAHQQKSRLAAQQKFAGGLADHEEETKRLHTATHLLHQALRTVLGEHVKQKGSNITRQRLRFDFSHAEALTAEQLKQTESLVNDKIREKLTVSWKEMGLEEARKTGAIGLFEERYKARVKVYSIGDFSKEICGGPHVENTGELGHLKITKEESCGAGVRRIKAILTQPTDGN